MSSLRPLYSALYEIGDALIQDDIHDFPFTDVGSSTHPGLVHHGAIGLVIRTLAYMGGMLDVANDVAQELQRPDPILEILKEFEGRVHPEPTW